MRAVPLPDQQAVGLPADYRFLRWVRESVARCVYCGQVCAGRTCVQHDEIASRDSRYSTARH